MNNDILRMADRLSSSHPNSIFGKSADTHLRKFGSGSRIFGTPNFAVRQIGSINVDCGALPGLNCTATAISSLRRE